MAKKDQDLLDAKPLSVGKVSRRGRTKIFAERKTVSLRLPDEVHQRMTRLCDDLQIPFNTYISDLIKADLKKRGIR